MATTIDTRDFFNSELFSDLTIVVDGAEIYCHKIILSSNSEYFANLLKAMDPPKVGRAVGNLSVKGPADSLNRTEVSLLSEYSTRKNST